MRVLFLTHNFPRHPGDAAGSFLLRLAAALRGEGVEVRVVAPAAPGLAERETVEGIEVRRFRYAPRALETLAYGGTMIREARRALGGTLVAFLVAQWMAARRELREWRPDVLHAHWWFPSGLAAAHAGGGVPLVTTMHGTDVRLTRDQAALRPLARHTLARSAAATTVSSWLAERVRAIAPACAPEVIPMPAAVELFAPPAPGSRAADRLLFVGRLTDQKGIGHLLSALARMRTRVALDVVGDGPLRDRLRLQANALGIADRIRWLGATLPPRELAAHYRGASAVVVPSIDEGLGLVAVEALLCGAPVVASASGGLVDVVRDGVTGILVPPSEPDALAHALDQLLARDDRGASLGVAGREDALARFAPAPIAARHAAVYHRVIGNAA